MLRGKIILISHQVGLPKVICWPLKSILLREVDALKYYSSLLRFYLETMLATKSDRPSQASSGHGLGSIRTSLFAVPTEGLPHFGLSSSIEQLLSSEPYCLENCPRLTKSNHKLSRILRGLPHPSHHTEAEASLWRSICSTENLTCSRCFKQTNPLCEILRVT